MNYNIDTVVFDLGGVLVDWDPKALYRKVFDTEKEVDWFLNNVCTSEWNLMQDEGRTIAEANQIKIAEFPKFEKEIKMFYERWDEMFIGTIDNNIKIQQKLINDSNYSVLALTNWSAEKWSLGKQLFPFFENFENVIVSGEENMRKPDDRIFQLLINRFNISPNKTVFIDDNKDNIAAARKNKLNAIHFTNNETDLASELNKFNINI